MEHIGIDVHKRECQVCILTERGELIERRIRTERGRLEELLGKRQRAKIPLEASTESEWVARWLEQMGHEVIVAAPNFAAMYATRSRKVKTDKRDARTLAEACKLGAYRPSYRVTDARRHIRAQLAVREALVKSRAQSIILCGALIRAAGLRVASGGPQTFVQRVERVTLPGELKAQVAPLLAVMLQLNQQIEFLDGVLERLSQQDEQVSCLCTVPGVGAVVASSFVCMVDEAGRFEGAHHVAAYLGLVPSENSSGEKQRKGHVTKAGNPRVRWLLVQSAHCILRVKNPDTAHLREWAEQIAAHPAQLPPGTQVGSWLVRAWAAQGVYGAIYQAVPLHSPHAQPVALKLALHPGDPRFAREALLLSRLRHPSVPRLWDSGTWQSPEGLLYPWLAMDWVDGTPLYHWALQPSASTAECVRVLAQLARALQALHSLGGVHRDLKGENILVQHSDGRAFLTDFGLGSFPGAELLTPPSLCLGTPTYRSPEAGLFELNSPRDGSARYVHTPADDLYALGMTACRMLTSEYPEWVDPTQDEHGNWRLRTVRTPAALRGVDPTVRALILRMLSVHPEQRGTAAELAEALERASHSPPARISSAIVEPREAQASPQAQSEPELARPSKPARPVWPWLLMAASVTLTVWAGWPVPEQTSEKTSLAQARTDATGSRDAGTAGLGDATSTSSTAESPEPSVHTPLAEEPLPEPQPGQMRPDARGRCPHKRQVALNGACWVPMDPEECDALGSQHNGKLFKGRCYVPTLSPDRPSTSHPSRTP